MYSILVCSDDDIIHYEDEDETLKEFSLLRSDADTEAFRINGDDFIWKAYCTTNGWVSADILRKERPRGTWDHLAFSFFYTDKNQTLEIPPYMCRIKTKKATSFRPFSRQDNKSNRTFEEMVYDEQIVHMLYEKIDESVDEAARRKYGIGMD
uniref:Uncharacterized protein n=1 Tax=Panagrolaimus davidi TaxID=227884 RepID=A0A914PGY6_9BILA